MIRTLDCFIKYFNASMLMAKDFDKFRDCQIQDSHLATN